MTRCADSQLADFGPPRRPRRILMTADTIGGVWTYALELAQALAPHEIEITLASMGPRPNARQQLDAARIPNLTLVESDFKLEWMDDPWRDVADAGQWLLELEQLTDPDIVHLNGYAHAAIEWNCPVMVVAHSCVLSWWRAVKQTALPAAWLDYRQHVARGLRKADLVVAPSQAMASALQLHYGAPQTVEVIYNAANATYFQPSRKEDFVFSAGRLWDEAKNIQSVARAAQDISWPVLVAGDDHAPDSRTINVKKVQLLGRLTREETAAYMARCSIYAFPARYEPFGLSILEAALSGCALVLGDIPSLREIWGFAAVYVTPEDPQQLAACINDLIVEPSRRAALAHAARRRASYFSPQRMVEQYLDAYSRLLEMKTCCEVAEHQHNRRGVPTCVS
jgi:glycogen(starch) synthase